MTKAVLYYTDNCCEERIATASRLQLSRCVNGLELVSVSQYPLPSFGRNIVLTLGSSILSMFRQIQAGLEAIKADVVFMAEHDVIYHPSHFEFTPPRADRYYFNTNVWMLDAATGRALHYDGMTKTSGLVAYRETLLEHYRRKVATIEESGWSRRLGFEPGEKLSKGRIDHKSEWWQSEFPNVDIKHDGCITPGRFELSQYQHGGRRLRKSWMLTDTIPHWGITEGRVDDWLRGLYDN